MKKLDDLVKNDKLCRKYDALGISKGNKIIKGKDTGEESLVFIVKEKVSPMYLGKKLIPEKISGYKTDVIDAGGEIEFMHKSKHRPVMGGISGKVEGGTACSIGVVCYKDGEKGILTNEHCCHYGGNNIGKKFLQPSPNDGGRVNDEIGIISSNPIMSNKKTNRTDSCFVPLSASGDLSVRGIESYEKEWVEPVVGMDFIKMGRTTGKTFGKISHINATTFVNTKEHSSCRFYPTIWALQNNYNIVNGGDSGSCIFNSQGVIGQTFAASPNLAIFIVGSVIGEDLGIELSQPQEGWVALAPWTEVSGHKIKFKTNTNFRSGPGLSNAPIKVIRRGDTVCIGDEIKKQDGYVWIKAYSS